MGMGLSMTTAHYILFATHEIVYICCYLAEVCFQKSVFVSHLVCQERGVDKKTACVKSR